MPKSYEELRAQTRVAYNYARLRGLPRNVANKFRTKEAVDAALAHEVPRAKTKSGITEPTFEHIAALRDNPYHYTVRVVIGSNAKETRIRYITVVSDHELTYSEIVSRAGSIVDGYSASIFASTVTEATHWTV